MPSLRSTSVPPKSCSGTSPPVAAPALLSRCNDAVLIQLREPARINHHNQCRMQQAWTFVHSQAAKFQHWSQEQTCKSMLPAPHRCSLLHMPAHAISKNPRHSWSAFLCTIRVHHVGMTENCVQPTLRPGQRCPGTLCVWAELDSHVPKVGDCSCTSCDLTSFSHSSALAQHMRRSFT